LLYEIKEKNDLVQDKNQNFISIQSDHKGQFINATIKVLLGKLILTTSDQTKIDLTLLPYGTYILEVLYDKASYETRIIKK